MPARYLITIIFYTLKDKRYNTQIVLRVFDIQTSDEHTVNDHVREGQHSGLNDPQGALPTPMIL